MRGAARGACRGWRRSARISGEAGWKRDLRRSVGGKCDFVRLSWMLVRRRAVWKAVLVEVLRMMKVDLTELRRAVYR